jgi:hypothetical protein
LLELTLQQLAAASQEALEDSTTEQMETPDQEDPEKVQAHDLEAQEDPSSGSLSEEEAEEVGV